MKFEDYKLDASICEALHTLGYQSPLPVQEAVIPLMLEKKDILTSGFGTESDQRACPADQGRI